jgi:hypothetical protein
MGVQLYNGGADHVHMGLIMMEVEYTTQVPSKEFMRSKNPGPAATIPDGASSVEANIMIHEHGEIIWSYCLTNNVNKACAKLLLDAFDDRFMST